MPMLAPVLLVQALPVTRLVTLPTNSASSLHRYGHGVSLQLFLDHGSIPQALPPKLTVLVVSDVSRTRPPITLSIGRSQVVASFSQNIAVHTFNAGFASGIGLCHLGLEEALLNTAQA